MKVALGTYSTRPRGGVVHTLALAEAMVELGAEVTVHAVAPSPGEGFFRPIDPRVDVRLASRARTAHEDVDSRVLASIDALASAIDPAAYEACPRTSISRTGFQPNRAKNSTCRA